MAVGGQRLRLAAAAIEGEHQLPVQAARAGVLAASSLQLAGQRGVAPAREVGLDPQL